MPRMMVGRILNSPKFRTRVQVIRTTVTLDKGRTVASASAPRTISAVVVQGSGDQLRRLAEGERIESTITVIAKERLDDGQAGRTADVVVWPINTGNRYTVTISSDYSEMSRGFWQSICTLQPMVPPA